MLGVCCGAVCQLLLAAAAAAAPAAAAAAAARFENVVFEECVLFLHTKKPWF